MKKKYTIPQIIYSAVEQAVKNGTVPLPLASLSPIRGAIMSAVAWESFFLQQEYMNYSAPLRKPENSPERKD